VVFDDIAFSGVSVRLGVMSRLSGANFVDKRFAWWMDRVRGATRVAFPDVLRWQTCRLPEHLRLLGDSRSILSACRLRGLKSLDLRGCRWVPPSNLVHVCKLGGLETLMLKGWDLGGHVCLLRKLGSLTRLELSECVMPEEEGTKTLAAMTGLRRLNVARVDTVGDECLAALCALTGLVSLDVSDNDDVTDDGVLAVCRGIPGLEKLAVRGCHEVTSASFAGIALLLRLVRLDLSHSLHIPGPTGFDSGLDELLPLVRLRELNLAGCCMTDHSVSLLADSDVDLKSLSVRGADISEDGLGLVVECFQGLKRLDVGDCCYISAAGYLRLGELPELEELSVAESSELDAAGVAVIGGLACLRALDVFGCANVTDASAVGLVAGLGCLRSLRTSIVSTKLAAACSSGGFRLETAHGEVVMREFF
tara:strand:+ start:975 stop:2237 length:1263 start_codon:yes stop_codon:yes gene_type:complete